MKRALTLLFTGLAAVIDTLPLLTAAAVTSLILAPGESQALPVDRAMGRAGARDSRQTGRQVSRARRRGCYAMPAGARPFVYGGYRYYRVGPRFYYPYMHMGRTVYVDIDVVGGNPAPPPPTGSIDITIY
jgi:hypothetical protein